MAFERSPCLHPATDHKLHGPQLLLTVGVGTSAAEHTVLPVLPLVAQLLGFDFLIGYAQNHVF